jgi:hypothetical protein
MDTKRSCQRLTVLTLVALLLCALATAGAEAKRPGAATDAYYRALALRSDGLNRTYHLGQYAAAGSDEAYYRALAVRSDGLNRTYHLGRYAAAPAAAVSRRGFAWGDAGIGAGFALGVIALLAAAALAARARTRTAGA